MAISQALAAQETGRVINEHYTREEYIRRRVGYLSRCSDYAHISNLFPIVRGHADSIFASGQERLSVQEVRRREQAEDIEDMLPLPTTNNTQTIDNFASYGPRSMEWSPGVAWPVVRPAKSATGMTQSTANIRLDVPTQQQTGTIVASATSDALTNNHSTSNKLAMDSSPTVDSMVRNQLTGPGQSTSPSSLIVRVHNDVAALSGRGISVPVKVKPNKNKVAATSPPSEANDSVLGDGAMKKRTLKPVSDVKVKQTRGKKRAAPSSSSPEFDASSTNYNDQSAAQTPESTPSPAKKLKSLKGPRKPSPPVKKSVAKPKSAAPPQARSIETVIAGTTSPQNASEANSASTTRHQRLLARNLAIHAGANDADLLPEFFNAATFDDDLQVRCICKAITDDGTGMVQCDKCTVWQHAVCMGVSYASHEADESKKYTCHVCDPWKHRRLVGRLRRANRLS